MSTRNGKPADPIRERKSEPPCERESGLNGVLCPVCGCIVESLPVRLHRFRGDYEEYLWVCSDECRIHADQSPYVQTNLFGRDLRIWSRSVQGELPLPEGRNGDGSPSGDAAND
jgi:hypothetical protein